MRQRQAILILLSATTGLLLCEPTVARARLPAIALGTQNSPDLPRAAQWVRAVERHDPGSLDLSVLLIANWNEKALQESIDSLEDYLEQFFYKNDPIRKNRLIIRGALLHTDISILAPEQAKRFAGFGASRPPFVEVGDDGRHLGSEPVTGHWELARRLLDRVTPDPAKDEAVRTWYMATTAWLQDQYLLGSAAPHLRHATRLFANDPDILVLNGAMHEALASSRFQGILEATPAARRRFVLVESARAELGSAERFFRRALAAQPGHAEARLRLGRVLGVLGRHAEAARELRALPDGADPLLVYYQQLFLGAEEEALGHVGLARTAFERAAALQPTAQSPLVALSRLASRSGDLTGAAEAIRRLAKLSADSSSGRDDPWWDYYSARTRRAADLLARLRGQFSSPDRP